MDNETILKLVSAGYTKADIIAMQSDNTKSGESDETKGKGTQTTSEIESNANAENAGKVAENENKAAEIGTHADINAAINALNDTVANLSATVKAMQDNNASKASTESSKSGDKVMETINSFIEKL